MPKIVAANAIAAPPPPSDDDLEAFTVEEVARRLRLSVDTVYNRIADGQLGHIRDGDGPKAPIRVLPSQLRKFINDRRVEPDS